MIKVKYVGEADNYIAGTSENKVIFTKENGREAEVSQKVYDEVLKNDSLIKKLE